MPCDPDAYSRYWRGRPFRFFVQTDDTGPLRAALLEVLGNGGVAQLKAEADAIGRGDFTYFSSQVGRLGFPPQWHVNPFTGQRTAADAHWNDIPVYAPESGDIKYIWEPGRFAAAYVLGRAFVVTGDPVYAEVFWQLVESWEEANPPQTGAHWRCGQETALRLMAWCFGLACVRDAPSTTPDRLARLVGMIAAQTERIAADHIYAFLQQNNHSISEGVGLWIVGLLFPELKRAPTWQRMGRAILERDVRRLVEDDGTFVQKSHNYHRLMLQDYLYAVRVGQTCGAAFSAELLERVQRAGAYLYQVQDDSGGVPNYGANDGALVVPLNTCDYRDFRPVCQVAHYLSSGRMLYDPGPWDEDALWLFGPAAAAASRDVVPRRDLAAPQGGVYTLRGSASWGFVRCGSFKSRPSHADLLHLDLWWRGTNIARDAGTFLYYAEPPWPRGLSGTAVHNTVAVDALDQMDRGPRFMWTNWLRASVRHRARTPLGEFAYFEGEHDGYARLLDPVTHRRAILRAGAECWLVVDDLIAVGDHACTLHWLLANGGVDVDDNTRTVSLETRAGSYSVHFQLMEPHGAETSWQVRRGTDDTAPFGWISEFYGVRAPCPSVAMRFEGTLPCRFLTVFGPGTCRLTDEHTATIAIGCGDQAFEVTLGPIGAPSIITRARRNGPGGADSLVISGE